MNTTEQLKKLLENIDAFLALHNNPFDTSSMQCKAVEVEKIAAVLRTQPKKPPTPHLQSSVGIGQENHAADVKLVKTYLNANKGLHELKQDTVDVGTKTDATIKNFQGKIGEPEDGIVAPGSNTWKALLKGGEATTASTTEEQTTDKETPPNSPRKITASVGKGGVNAPQDVRAVKELINERVGPKPQFGEDYIEQMGPVSIEIIQEFQQRMGAENPSGLIEPNDKWWKVLVGSGTIPPPLDTVKEVAVSTSIPSTISSTVGSGGVNKVEEVKLVKALLNKKMNAGLDENNGEAGADLLEAIKQLQANHSIRQSGLIEPQRDTWNALIMNSIGFSTDMYDKAPKDHTIGGAETAVEKELAEFAMFFEGIPIDVEGETVFVRPPYHINNTKNPHVRSPKIQSVLSAAMGFDRQNTVGNARVGKATPPQIQRFLQTCVDKGLAKDTTAKGLRDFLDEHCVSSDCSGLAVQAANFLLQDGDMERHLASGEDVDMVGASGIYNQPEVSSPAKLKASDMMVTPGTPGHVRVLIDVDIEDHVVLFTTLESTGYAGVSDEGDGVGQRRWRFPNKDKKEGLQEQVNGQWRDASADDRRYKYVHFAKLKDRRTEDEQM